MEIQHIKFVDNLVTVGTEKKGNRAHYPFDAGLFAIPTSLCPVDLNSTRTACREGCKNYNNNGGCPPYVTELSKLAKGYSYMYPFYILFHMYDGPIRALIKEDAKRRVRR